MYQLTSVIVCSGISILSGYILALAAKAEEKVELYTGR